MQSKGSGQYNRADLVHRLAVYGCFHTIVIWKSPVGFDHLALLSGFRVEIINSFCITRIQSYER